MNGRENYHVHTYCSELGLRTWDLCELALKEGIESTVVWLLEVQGKGEGHNWWCNCELKPTMYVLQQGESI